MSETHDESKRNRRTAKRILAIGLPLVIIAATGVGYAFWTSNGSGTGTATANGSVGSVTFHGTLSGLKPGGKVSLQITADNGTGSQIGIPSVTVAAAPLATFTDAAHATAGCTPSLASLTFDNLVMAATPAVVPANTLAFDVATVDVTMGDTSSNQDACKGAPLSLAISAP